MEPPRTGFFNFSFQIIICLIVIFLTGCVAKKPNNSPSPTQNTTGGYYAPVKMTKNDGPPPLPHKSLDDIPDATPKHEPLSKYGNKNPYKVWGKTYYLLPTSKDYKEKGIASWYGTKFHGRRTSSGEPYDLYGMTAAHKSLPLPTYVKVTNRNNGRSVIVKVNDRGPFHSKRVIDLSYAAAAKLGYANSGTAPVIVEAIDPNRYIANKSVIKHEKPQVKDSIKARKKTYNESQLTSPSEFSNKTQIYLQVGAYSNSDRAHIVKQELAELIDEAPVVVSTDTNGDSALHKVKIGPLNDDDQVLVLLSKLEPTHYKAPLILRE